MRKLYDKIYREFFYIPKHAKVPEKVFRTRIILSTLTMLICCAVFCSGTFAWFTSNQRTEIPPITAASYSLLIAVDGTEIGTSNNENNVSYTCPLAAEDEHTVTFTSAGTAETGYCVINAGGKTYSTAQIGKGESMTLTIQAAQDEEITFSANWGAPQGGVATISGNAGDSYSIYGDGDCIEVSRTPYESYTVAEGVSLEQIAEHYGVSASDILLYNGITEITVGMEIKIPNTEVTEPPVVEEEVSYVLYTVAEGVTIDMLAEYYGVSADDILNFNNITELIVGETIKIPNTEVTEPFELPDEEPTSEQTEETATPSDATESTKPSEEEPSEPSTEETTEPSIPAETEAQESTEATTEPTAPAESLPVSNEPPVAETTAPQETEAAPEPEPTSAPEPSTEVSIEPEEKSEPEPEVETTGEDTP